MSKDYFYAGLGPEHHPMVVHLKDQARTTPLDLLRALLHNAENDTPMCTCHPPSASTRPSIVNKVLDWYRCLAQVDKRVDGYTSHLAQIDLEPQDDTSPEIEGDLLEKWYGNCYSASLALDV